MTVTAAINDNYGEAKAPQAARAVEEEIIGSAVLVATAFRLRDETALITMLRRLCTAVATLEEINDREQ